jgi:hypothetical protein
MVASPKGLGPEDYAGKTQKHVQNQTRPLVREGAPQKQDRNCQTAIDTKTYWLTDRQSQCDFDFDFGEKNWWSLLNRQSKMIEMKWQGRN